MPLGVVHVAELFSIAVTSIGLGSPTSETGSLRLSHSLSLELAIFEVQRSVITLALF
jgi:hypothetical protein